MLITGTVISSYQTISTVTFKYHGTNVVLMYLNIFTDINVPCTLGKT